MALLDGRVAVISGGSRGQGAEEARLFAREGAHVIVGDILEEEGRALVEEIAATGGSAVFQRLDVSQPDDWTQLAKMLDAAHGRAHILVNNAGITHRAGFEGTSLEDWRRVLDINLTGAFLGIKSLVPLMRKAGRGAIVNIGSIAGYTGYHSVSYGASKWALLGMTRSAAMEYAASNIRVNAVCPGVVETPLATGASSNFDLVMRLTPQGRPGGTSEIAQLVLFLVSDHASFITGEDIAIDGGMNAGGLFRHIALETGVYPRPAEDR